MPRKISNAIGVSADDLDQVGAFDAFVDFDSRLYVDPSLLARAAAPELRQAYRRFRRYFVDVLRLLQASKRRKDRMYRAAVQRLTFPEEASIRLGYSSAAGYGSGIGLELASNLAKTAKEIQEAGINDPVIFELAGLIEDGIGADRISDMTIKIVFPELLKYSERIAEEVGATTTRVTHETSLYDLPLDTDTAQGVVLVPKEILRDLPVAEDWSEVELVASHNAALRGRVNKVIGKTWRHATRIPKWELRRTLLENPELLQDLINRYKQKARDPYDFERDPAGEIGWYRIATRFADEHPLSLALVSRTARSIRDVVRMICHHYKRLIEVNGLDIHLYGDSGSVRHERYAQRLFYGIADSYCTSNDLDISPESNAGSGPVDFKFSRGSKTRVNVEVKYSRNPNLVHGYTKQLPQYDKAEKAQHSIYLIIRVTESETNIERVLKKQTETRRRGKRAPEIIVVDGRRTPTASKL